MAAPFAVAVAGQAGGQTGGSDALAQAGARAEGQLQFEAAAARLIQLVEEQPRAREVPAARLQLARVLAVENDVPAALLQCQAVRDELAADNPLRATALNLASTLARRLRPSAVFFATPNPLPIRGLPGLDEPDAIDVQPSGAFLLVDAGAGHAYAVSGDAATALAGATDITAAAYLPDGTVAASGKTGVTIGGAPVAFSGTWGGKARQLKKVRSMAAMSGGDLLVIDRDADGLLRCKREGAACAPWGPPGKPRKVKVGPADFTYLLDDHQQTLRVLDGGGHQIAAIGPLLNGVKIGEIVDLAIDSAHGLYFFDKDSKRLEIVALRAAGTGAPAFVPVGTLTIPPTTMKNVSAIAVAPDGALLVAGRSDAKVLKIQ